MLLARQLEALVERRASGACSSTSEEVSARQPCCSRLVSCRLPMCTFATGIGVMSAAWVTVPSEVLAPKRDFA